MKIMHVIPSLTRGGAERLLLIICKGLADIDANVRVKVLALFDSLELLGQFTAAGIDVECLRLPRRGMIPKLSAVHAAIGRWRPDIVHTHLNHADRYGQSAAFLRGVRIRVMSVHNIERRWRAQEALTRYCGAALAARIVAVSQSVKEECVRRRVAPAAKISVIYNAPAFVGGRTQPRRHPGAALRLVNVGKLDMQKGQRFAIGAMEAIRLRAPGSTLDIYGPDAGGFGSVLRGEITARGLEAVVRLNGPVDTVGEALDRADVFIASSLWEGFHMAVVEAMSHGLPVVATDIAPHREIMAGMPESILVEPGSAAAIADAVIRLSADPLFYERLSAAGMERARFFSQQRMVGEYYALYRSLMEERAAGESRTSGT